MPLVCFASPRALPRADRLTGRVVVLDLAFAGNGLGKPFKKGTYRFIHELGERLAAWVDHHDHLYHERFKDDARFVLSGKKNHPSCSEMVTFELVERVGRVDTVVCHRDLDGLYSAAKWILGGGEPYPGADSDARAVDTRIGSPSRTAELLDAALRALPDDDTLGRAVLSFLVSGCDERTPGFELVRESASRFEVVKQRSGRIARSYHLEGKVAVVEVEEAAEQFDKTELLLLGQQLAPVAVVKQGAFFTAAAPFDSGLDLVTLMELGGGMPTRISLSASRLGELVLKVNSSLI